MCHYLTILSAATALDRGGLRAVAASDDCTIKVIDLQTFSVVNSIPGTKYLSPQSLTLRSSGFRGHLHFSNLQLVCKLLTVQHMMEPYSALVWRPMMRIWCLDPLTRLLRYGDNPDCRTRDSVVVMCDKGSHRLLASSCVKASCR